MLWYQASFCNTISDGVHVKNVLCVCSRMQIWNAIIEKMIQNDADAE